MSPQILLTYNLPLERPLSVGVALAGEALHAIFNWYLSQAILYNHLF